MPELTTTFQRANVTSSDSNDLTERQQRVYEVIREKINTRGYGPTVREIGEILNISSPNGVMCHLRALERKGKISRAANKSRAIELTEKSHRLGGNVMLPVHGSTSATKCTFVSEETETLNVGDLFAGTDRFALRVKRRCSQGRSNCERGFRGCAKAINREEWSAYRC